MKTETIEQFLYRNHAKRTAGNYMYTLNHFLATNPRADNYLYKDIISYLKQMHERYQKPESLCPILLSIKRYYDYLIATGQRNDHPCKHYTIKGIKRKGGAQVQDLFSSQELQKILNREVIYPNLELRNKVIIGFLIYQGLKSEEIIKMDVNDVDIDTGTVYIKSSKKSNSRTMTLHTTQTHIIYRYIHEARPLLTKTTTSRLLITQRGVPQTAETISAMIECVQPLFPDRHLCPQTIRQSVIANWLNVDRKPLEEVQLLAGHKYPSTTESYRSKDAGEQRKLINKFHPLK